MTTSWLGGGIGWWVGVAVSSSALSGVCCREKPYAVSVRVLWWDRRLACLMLSLIAGP